ncbi:hypothetical protein Dsin_022149 [Dipteronia sinensis]|uniref:DUF4283 domain-containing protein n=1 Tax=Dipteronia sinensis TaxID=43782 RepID=A0AAE0A1Y5_9ROSI|nr:hypothetical protein Dsin_022149 [Dipteronia sinensis]
MNAEKIIKLCEGLSFKEKDGQACTLDVQLKNKSEHRLTMCLVGKVLKQKLVNREVFINVMRKIWKVNGGIEIEPIAGNVFAFYFSTLEDRQRILKGGPWSFDGASILFEKPAGVGELRDMGFKLVDFWVQIHNIPLLCLTEEIGLFMGNMIGVVHDVDLGAVVDGASRFLRMRVTVEVDKPLQRCLLVDLLGNGKVTTMLLRYERLMDYCFRCDRIGHVMDGCIWKVDEERNVFTEASRKLAVWLRASSPPKRSWRGKGRVEPATWGKTVGFRGWLGEVEKSGSSPALIPDDGMVKTSEIFQDLRHISGPLDGPVGVASSVKGVLSQPGLESDPVPRMLASSHSPIVGPGLRDIATGPTLDNHRKGPALGGKNIGEGWISGSWKKVSYTGTGEFKDNNNLGTILGKRRSDDINCGDGNGSKRPFISTTEEAWAIEDGKTGLAMRHRFQIQLQNSF